MTGKFIILYSMKTCPMCQEVKKLMEEKNINFIDRDIHENEKEYESFVKQTKNEYVPAFTVVKMEESEVKDVKYLTPDDDFEDINEAVEKLVRL